MRDHLLQSGSGLGFSLGLGFGVCNVLGFLVGVGAGIRVGTGMAEVGVEIGVVCVLCATGIVFFGAHLV